MELLKILGNDHKEIQGLLKKLEATTERGVKIREKLFIQMKNLLDAHAKAEEVVLYDRLKREGHEAREVSFEGYEEHHVAKILLRELTMLAKDDERWGAKLKVLSELFNHHVEEEESQIWKAARKAFSREQFDDMGEEFEVLRDAHIAGVGMPARVVSRVAQRIATVAPRRRTTPQRRASSQRRKAA